MKALVIDDKQNWRDAVCRALATIGVQAEPLASRSEALVRLRASHPCDLVTLDLFDEGEPIPAGLRFLSDLRGSGINVPVIVVTGETGGRKTKIIRNLFHEYRIADFFEKQAFDEREFLESVRSIQEQNEPALDHVLRICHRFHLLAHAMGEERHDGRQPFRIQDEYDVQDLLGSVLRIYFDDIRPEEWAPSVAGRSSRMDFLLREHKIGIEVKKTRRNLDDRKVGEELILDAAKYKAHPDCKTLVCLVYDPDHFISNVSGVEADVASASTEKLKVIPVIVPRT